MSAAASAPATIANLGPGFDIAGMAIEGYRDLVEISLRDDDVVEVQVEGREADRVDDTPRGNSAAVAASHVLRRAGVRKGFNLKLVKNVPVGVGLGSSGASSAAGAYAANLLIGRRLGMRELVLCAAEGERAACGSPHLDNVAPSLYGGFTIILDIEGPEILHVKPMPGFEVIVATPHVSLPKNKTEYARSLLPREVPMETLVRQQASVARLVASILKGDLEQFGKAVSMDHVVEPARAGMIPGFREVKKRALEKGALGLSISGAGPSIFAITRPQDAEKVAKAIKEAFEEKGVKTSITRTTPSTTGARPEPTNP